MVWWDVSEEFGLGDLKVFHTLSLIGFFLFNEISLSISSFCCCTFAFANSLFIFFISMTSSSGVNDVFIESSTNPTTTYMKIPLGFRSSKRNTILKLLKSLYGHNLAPRLFFSLLFHSLTKLEFIQSLYDECLWHRDNIFIIIFVDDCGICAETVALIDELIADLRSLRMVLRFDERKPRGIFM